MKLSQLDYLLPKQLIAQSPADPRDSSKLLVLNRSNGITKHHKFYELPDLLTENDVLVFNQTKVFPARLLGKKESSGIIEVLLLKQLNCKIWEGIYKGKVAPGQIIEFNSFSGKIIEKSGNAIKIEFSLEGTDFWSTLNKYGKTPIPPYIGTSLKETELRKKYQTVYAKNVGSAAAPTAGFHFTNELINKLKARGIQTEYVTLHVGLGTFAPIKEENIENHQIHEESFTVDPATVARLNKAKKSEKRIIAVGTTTTRVLETLAGETGLLTTDYTLPTTNLFIYPPYKFKFVDAMVTNFHLPKSTLLALISAFVSYPNTSNHFVTFKNSLIGKGYKEAIKKRYRFYSFGDAMLTK